MFRRFHELTPENALAASESLLKICGKVQGNNYIADLSIRIEREKFVLGRSIAAGEGNELVRLLFEADAQFSHSVNLFQDLAEIKTRIDFDPFEQVCANRVYQIIFDHLLNPLFHSRQEQLDAVEQMIGALECEEMTNALVKSGLISIFNDLRSKYRIVRGITKEWDEHSDETPPPSVAFRRLVLSMKELHDHFANYSRLGNREYRKHLHDIDAMLQNIHCSANGQCN